MAYPEGNLSTRAIIKPGKFTLIPPEGRVNNNIPGLENCQATVLASPDIGAGFAEYVIEFFPEGKTVEEFAQKPGVEAFIYVIKGEGKVKIGDEERELTQGGFAYSPPDKGVNLKNTGEASWKIFVHKQVYKTLEGYSARTVFGNAGEIEGEIYEDMENVFLKTFLPEDPGFDVNFHILTFEPDGSHPFVETHLQEHGLYMLSGQGLYLLDDEWVPVQKEDFIWFGPFTPQAFYCTGRENTSYVYSKNCNRDVDLL